jgi:hypothetical protein
MKASVANRRQRRTSEVVSGRSVTRTARFVCSLVETRAVQPRAPVGVVPHDAFCDHSTEKFRESIALAWKSLGHKCVGRLQQGFRQNIGLEDAPVICPSASALLSYQPVSPKR